MLLNEHTLYHSAVQATCLLLLPPLMWDDAVWPHPWAACSPAPLLPPHRFSLPYRRPWDDARASPSLIGFCLPWVYQELQKEEAGKRMCCVAYPSSGVKNHTGSLSDADTARSGLCVSRNHPLFLDLVFLSPLGFPSRENSTVNQQGFSSLLIVQHCSSQKSYHLFQSRGATIINLLTTWLSMPVSDCKLICVGFFFVFVVLSIIFVLKKRQNSYVQMHRAERAF